MHLYIWVLSRSSSVTCPDQEGGPREDEQEGARGPHIPLLLSVQIKQCLTKMAGMSVADMTKHYGFVEELVAQNLKTRATGEEGGGRGGRKGVA